MPSHQHIIVFGGTRGIGNACARLLSAGGFQVTIVGRSSTKKNSSPNIQFIKGDLRKPKQLAQAISQVIKKRGLDGIVFFQRFRGEDDLWKKELELSLTATMEMIENLSKQMSKGGSVVIAGSSASTFIAEEMAVGYHVAKAGLAHMTRYYATQLGPKGIRVNCVSFPAVLKAESKEFYLNNKPLYDLYRRITPLRRMGTAEEIAEVVNFLISKQSSFVTGQNIFIDGGISLQWQESLARKLVPQVTKMKVVRGNRRKRK